MWDVGEEAPRRAETHVGQVWVHVIRRSVRSCGAVSVVMFRGWILAEEGGGWEGREKRTMPVAWSTLRDRVSTAMTWLEVLFHGQYFCQFAVETSDQE